LLGKHTMVTTVLPICITLKVLRRLHEKKPVA
jgi:hypothetical protein